MACIKWQEFKQQLPIRLQLKVTTLNHAILHLIIYISTYTHTHTHYRYFEHNYTSCQNAAYLPVLHSKLNYKFSIRSSQIHEAMTFEREFSNKEISTRQALDLKHIVSWYNWYSTINTLMTLFVPDDKCLFQFSRMEAPALVLWGGFKDAVAVAAPAENNVCFKSISDDIIMQQSEQSGALPSASKTTKNILN